MNKLELWETSQLWRQHKHFEEQVLSTVALQSFLPQDKHLSRPADPGSPHTGCSTALKIARNSAAVQKRSVVKQSAGQCGLVISESVTAAACVWFKSWKSKLRNDCEFSAIPLSFLPLYLQDLSYFFFFSHEHIFHRHIIIFSNSIYHFPKWRDHRVPQACFHQSSTNWHYHLSDDVLFLCIFKIGYPISFLSCNMLPLFLCLTAFYTCNHLDIHLQNPRYLHFWISYNLIQPNSCPSGCFFPNNVVLLFFPI